MSIQVDIKASFGKRLAAIADIDFAEAMETIGQDLASLVRLGFRLSQDPYGDAWEQLSFRKGKPLEDTGHLRQSFHADTDRNRVTVGTNVPYAAVHQYGAVIMPVNAKTLAWQVGQAWHFAKRVEIPARPMLPNESEGLPESWSESITDILLEHVSGNINAN